VLINEGVRVFADRTAVARYAAMVDRVARTGDAVAIRVLEEAAGEMAETLELLVERAGLRQEAVPFVGSGGVIQHSDIFWNSLTRNVAAFLPRSQPLRQVLPQSAGLALAGLMQAIEAGEVKADVARTRARLFETLPGLLKEKKRQGAA
jgi:N-acetylglucosamine kinase-like BadF-type ATPase